MKQFHYSLQKILDLRHFQLKQAEMDLGKVNAQIAAVEGKLKDIAAQRVRIAHEVDSAHDDMFLYQSAHAYFLFLDQKKESLLETLAQLQLVAEQKKAVVRAAMQREKVLARLKDNKLAAWKDEVLREEELVVDDVVTAKYNVRSS